MQFQPPRAGALLPLLLTLLLCQPLLAKKEFVAPEVHSAATYPAHDAHPDEKVTIAIDPHDTAQKSSIFTVHYADAGVVPVRLIVTNDGDRPISLTSMHIELITAHRSKLTPLDADDLYRRLSKPSRNDRPTVPPLPLPRRKIKGGISPEMRDEIQNAQFAAKAVEPHSTQAGFLFFDVRDISDPLAGAELDITKVHNSQGGELMFFEIPFDAYFHAATR